VSSAEYLFTEIKRHKTGAFLLVGGLLVCVAGLTFFLLVLGNREAGNRPPNGRVTPAQEMKIARLSANGKVQTAAISPDGKFLAYVVARRQADRNCARHRNQRCGDNQQLSLRLDCLAEGAHRPAAPASFPKNYVSSVCECPTLFINLNKAEPQS